MSVLKAIFNELFVGSNASSNAGGRTPDTSGNKEILVKHNGRLQRITLNKYGEIIARKNT